MRRPGRRRRPPEVGGGQAHRTGPPEAEAEAEAEAEPTEAAGPEAKPTVVAATGGGHRRGRPQAEAGRGRDAESDTTVGRRRWPPEAGRRRPPGRSRRWRPEEAATGGAGALPGGGNQPWPRLRLCRTVARPHAGGSEGSHAGLGGTRPIRVGPNSANPGSRNITGPGARRNPAGPQADSLTWQPAQAEAARKRSASRRADMPSSAGKAGGLVRRFSSGSV
ncbi:hypothetical protein GCM10017786_17770 [Amycolatopsis deserti]|uniref:Uncharacterized protein n=1 Tax=Amycolatopsis deserti TaxID=185696 RepID=A0ABQ3IP23_9PSEU|nr:hypothetical protein GCM10017786_17770 [Amycolatopsis deserti]